MAKSGARKFIKPVAATIGVVGTMASIWWFALKPRRKPKDEPSAGGNGAGPAHDAG